MSEPDPGQDRGQAAGFCPCFPVTDMRAALAHYERLGFEVMRYTDGAEWAWARFGTAELHLYLRRDHDPARTAAAADLYAEDCEALARQWSETGVSGTSEPYDTPHGMREAVHVDLDNNLIRLVTPLNRA